jgi:protein-tyrosine phosphatase/ADP-ribosylglycohydrolase
MNQDPEIAGSPPKPFPNCYWVEPGRLLAGEYPGGSSRSDPGAAVEALLHARVSCFIDLTQPKEMIPYENLLEDAGAGYHRFPIVDHGIPRAPETLTAVVAAIDAALEAGRCVYVHCRAGIGRTGMAVAAYLVSGGLTPDQALERLQVLWKQNARSASWPRSPETNQQWEYVRRWRGTGPVAAAPVSISAADRIEGAMLGLAIGDAIANVMAQSRLDATHAIADIARRPVIETGAQTAMTVAVAESLLGRKGHDAADQLTRYLQWTKQAGAVAVPPELKRALATWQWRKMLTGSHDPKNLDAHTLARTLAVVLYSIRTPRAAMDLVVDVSRVTLQSPTVLDLCRVWAAMLFDALAGTPKPILLSMQRGPQMQQLQQRILRPELDAVMRGQWQEQAGGDNAPSTVAAALLALQGAKTFSSGMPRALSSSRNPAVAGALYGAIAGAVFGVRAIPEDWRRRVHGEAALRALAQRLTAS